MELKTRTETVIDMCDWDNFVQEVYGKPYKFQQQDECRDRGTYKFTVPDEWADDYKNDSIPEEVNGEEMGVSFKAWLARDPKQKLSNPDDQNDWSISLFWKRNFYPDFGTLVNDLHSKGLLNEGEYTIEIDW